MKKTATGNEEIQSRREFFKRGAKMLPAIAGVALGVVKLTSCEDLYGCGASCMELCMNDCQHICGISCADGCGYGCGGNACRGNCGNGCGAGCGGNCTGGLFYS